MKNPTRKFENSVPALNRGRFWLPPFILGLIISSLYFRVLSFPFLSWDDFEFIRDNPALKIADFHNFKRIFTPGGIPGEMLFIPFCYFSFLCERFFFDLQPHIVHLNNVILHWLNSILVYLFLKNFANKRWVAMVSAITFAIHPLMVEPVAWAMGRKDVLSTFLGLIALLSYIFFVESQKIIGYIFSLLLFLVGLLVKPTLLTLPLILLLIRVYKNPQKWSRLYIEILPYILLSVCVLSIHKISPHDFPSEVPGLFYRIAGFPSVIFAWIARIFLISKPSPFYCWPEGESVIKGIFSWFFLALFLAIAFFAFVKKKDLRPFLFGIFFSLTAFLPAFDVLLRPREFCTADRYGYFPLLGVFYSIVMLRNCLPKKASLYYSACLVAWLSLLAGSTYQQISIWSTSHSLWSTAASNCPESSLIYNNLGMAQLDSGHIDVAVQTFMRGLEVNGAHPPIYSNLGRLNLQQKKFEKALHFFLEGLKIAPNNARLLKGLGDTYKSMGKNVLAIQAYKKSITSKPNRILTYQSLGNCLLQMGKISEAEAVFKNSLQVNSQQGPIYFNLGLVYEKQGTLQKAIHSYEQAIAFHSNVSDSHYNLANIYGNLGEFQKALHHYSQVLRVEPNKVEALINSANLFFLSKNYVNAELFYKRALKFASTHSPGIHYNLGLIHVNKNNPEQARIHFMYSIESDDGFGPSHYELSKIYFGLEEFNSASHSLEKARSLGVEIDQEFAQRIHLELEAKSQKEQRDDK